MTASGLSCLVRSDDGGLGALTWEFWRHMWPARTLVVMTNHRSRGRSDISRFMSHSFDQQTRFTPGGPTSEDIDWLLTDAQVVYTAETWYSTALPQIAAARGVRTVLHAMPEMDGKEQADLTLIPTEWRHETMPHTVVLPVPIATDRFTTQPREQLTTLYHVASAAMCDRNGLDIVLATMAHVRSPIKLVIRAPGQPGPTVIGPVRIEWLPHHHGPYFEAWPEGIDALIMPRRFGGLCLPVQEAWAQGIPALMTDLDPQRNWISPDALVPAYISELAHMKGGTIEVHDSDPRAWAQRIDDLAADPDRFQRLSDQARRLSDGLAWHTWTDRYQEILGQI